MKRIIHHNQTWFTSGMEICCNTEQSITTIISIKMSKKKQKLRGFPGGPVVKNPPANAGDTGSSPGPGRSYMPQSN